MRTAPELDLAPLAMEVPGLAVVARIPARAAVDQAWEELVSQLSPDPGRKLDDPTEQSSTCERWVDPIAAPLPVNCRLRDDAEIEKASAHPCCAVCGYGSASPWRL